MLGPGSIVADRFTLGEQLGAGGMGVVYAATDLETGASVALKMMLGRDLESGAARRFAMETEVLAQLAHPAIVAHVAHGLTPEGLPWLAMERLEGEDLGARLLRGPLSLEEVLRMARRVADALRIAHAKGIVHRDLKPSNLFLRGGQVDGVTLLDFGIARRAGRGDGLTRTGRLVGTPEYMSPEQARGAAEIGPPADVFSFGCVLYRCLTGRAPFAADQLVATLARILFDAAPPLGAVRPDLPGGLCALVDRTLQKAPEDRFPDAAALLRELDALGPLADAGGTAPPPAGLSRAELELVSVLLVGPLATRDAAPPTWTDDEAAPAAPSAAALVQALSVGGALAERLVDGSFVVTFAQRGAADQAVEAASCARRAARRWPELTYAIATARQVSGAALPIGEALDRAAALLATAPPGVVLLDTVTTALLDGRMATRAVDRPTDAPVTGRPSSSGALGRAAITGAHALAEETLTSDGSRPLLGKPTPCVGRDQELGLLAGALGAVLEEDAARAVLVVGPAGIGKSRLRHELLQQVRRRGEERTILVMEGRGELLRAGTPHGVVSDLLRRHFGVTPDDTPEVARARLRAGTADVGDDSVAALLGELCDVRFPDADDVRLRAARQDPRVLQVRAAEALVRFLRVATTRDPVVVVLEDLHWGDRASVELVGAALRELADQPLLVVGFARPEIHELAPGVWKDRAVELPLRPLARRACELLVRRVTGGALDAGAIARIAAQSDGNALFLEELIRAACAGETEALPETVLAMLQTRIARLHASERRALRAASVYGEAFDAASVHAVLGPSIDANDVERWLAELVEREVLERDAVAATPGSAAPHYRFRHALMREAAYGLMVDADRRLGHRLAAQWLAGRGHDPGLVAEHLLLAARPAEAGPWFVRAADRAMERDDFTAAARLARRGREGGAEGEPLGSLAAVEAYAAIVLWDWEHASALVATALALLPDGSRHHILALRAAGQLHAYRNDADGLPQTVARALATEPRDDAVVAYADTLTHMASNTIQVGLPALGRALLTRVEQRCGDVLPRYPAVRAWVNLIRCTWHRHMDDALVPQLALLHEALRLYEEAGASAITLALAGDVLGEVECRAGALDEGERRLRSTHATALEVAGSGFSVAHARLALANALAARAERSRGLSEGVPSPESLAAGAEAETLAHAILDTPGISAGYRAMAHDVLAATRLAAGDHAAAEREARAAIALSPHTPVRRWLMVAHLAEALVRSGRAQEADELATAALVEVEAYGGAAGYGELPLRRAAARARAAVGGDASALEAAVDAYRERQASAFADPAARARYLAG